MQTLRYTISDTPAGTGLRLCLPLQIAHTPDFFELVPRGFLTLGVRRDQEHLLPQRTAPRL